MLFISNDHFSRLLVTHPVLLLSTRKGRSNSICPLTWYLPLSCDPPMVGISLKPSTASYHNIRESGDFILSIPHGGFLKSIHFCGTHSGRDLDKLRCLNLETARGKAVSPLLLTGCLANIECRVRNQQKMGNRPFFAAEILSVSINGNYYVDGNIPQDQMVYHLGGNQYRVGDEIHDMSDVRPGYVSPDSII